MKPRFRYSDEFPTAAQIAATKSAMKMPDDMGLNATKHIIQNAQAQLVAKFDAAIKTFIEGVEACEIEMMKDAAFVASRSWIVKPLNEDDQFSYFIWRSVAGPFRVLAYRFSTGFHADDNTHAVSAEFSFQHGEIREAAWPEGLRGYIGGLK